MSEWTKLLQQQKLSFQIISKSSFFLPYTEHQFWGQVQGVRSSGYPKVREFEVWTFWVCSNPNPT